MTYAMLDTERVNEYGDDRVTGKKVRRWTSMSDLDIERREQMTEEEVEAEEFRNEPRYPIPGETE